MRILISGAGVAEPILAWWLSRSGVRITILEKSHSLKAIGQTSTEGNEFGRHQGAHHSEFPAEGVLSATSQYEILRGDLAVMLAQAWMKSPNVEYKFGTTASKVLSNDDTTVKVELSNGEVHEYDLLVAADGQWSKTRRLCFPEEDVTAVDKGMYAVYWTIYHARGSRVLTIRPDPHGTMRATFTYMPCNEAKKKEWAVASRSDRKAQYALLRRYFADAGWQAQRLLDSMDNATDFYFQAIQQIRMST